MGLFCSGLEQGQGEEPSERGIETSENFSTSRWSVRTVHRGVRYSSGRSEV